MKNYEAIKQMTIEQMADMLKDKQCEECPYQPDWSECKQMSCWVNGDTYLNWLKSEVQL